MARTSPKARRRRPARPRSRRPAARGGFVGRDPSPVLDRYPPRAGSPPAPRPLTAPTPPPTAARSLPTPQPPPGPPSPPAGPLIRLDAGFDLDGFSGLLGQPSIRVTVPRGDLPEVLRRVTEFMGFGIYVYSIVVRPAPDELLRAFVVELQRVDFSAGDRAWVPFVEKGVADSPFGPTHGAGSGGP